MLQPRRWLRRCIVRGVRNRNPGIGSEIPPASSSATQTLMEASTRAALHAPEWTPFSSRAALHAEERAPFWHVRRRTCRNPPQFSPVQLCTPKNRPDPAACSAARRKKAPIPVHAALHAGKRCPFRLVHWRTQFPCGPPSGLLPEWKSFTPRRGPVGHHPAVPAEPPPSHVDR